MKSIVKIKLLKKSNTIEMIPEAPAVIAKHYFIFINY
jgi:hypothetical protein